jgi:hypothetical protein
MSRNKAWFTTFAGDHKGWKTALKVHDELFRPISLLVY